MHTAALLQSRPKSNSWPSMRCKFKLTPDMKPPEGSACLRMPPQPHCDINMPPSRRDEVPYAPVCCHMQVQKCGGRTRLLPGTQRSDRSFPVFENEVRHSETSKRGRKILRLAPAANHGIASTLRSLVRWQGTCGQGRSLVAVGISSRSPQIDGAVMQTSDALLVLLVSPPRHHTLWPVLLRSRPRLMVLS
ncbi:uncharacterized protein PAC_13378 [Phialocephala subalpina]|uniref:Uncharacterized protein n=1 Tax=Phialocephala subalpina TaxID=576137 RepID=A0A1L7XEM7_9HELO|nr:uncharacterized protein PAC_13378 [Phialocephala subalpina]